MNKHFYRRVGALFLICSLLILPSCSSDDDNGDVDGAEESGIVEKTEEEYVSDGAFGIGYVAEEGLNPYSVSSNTNLAAAGLIYDTLFLTNESFETELSLCQTYNPNETYTEYTFVIREGVKFSDGSDMTVEDVIYSLEQAKDSSMYSKRLSIVSKVSTAVNMEGEEIENAVTVSLSTSHGNLPILLDLPIIKSGTAGQEHPLGTGAYTYSGSSSAPMLVKNEYYWQGDVPIDSIYLMETDDTASAFNSSKLDLIIIDPTTTSLSLQGSLDIRSYNTSVMEYVGFNMSSVTNQSVRQAIGYAIDREDVIQSCLSGSCSESTIPVHPSAKFYNSDLSKSGGYNMDMAAQILAQAQVTAVEDAEYSETLGEGDTSVINENEEEDSATQTDNSEETTEQAQAEAEAGVIEALPSPSEELPAFDLSKYQAGQTQDTWLTLKLLVCSDSTSRYESAKVIANSLGKLGIEVTVVGKSYEDYVAALSSGSFDMYYGQVKLQSDFNLKPLLGSSGSINYGRVSSDILSDLMSAFLVAGEDEKQQAADNMNSYILEYAPIAVIGFKRMNIISRQGTVMEISPHQDNIFSNITQWKITV